MFRNWDYQNAGQGGGLHIEHSGQFRCDPQCYVFKEDNNILYRSVGSMPS